ncbi:MAG: RNA-binding protein [Thermoprotei archaeon]|nr:MAG: RNA-binding protein [Thermoprotei archaeon]
MDALILVKTIRGLENVAASRLKELFPNAEVLPRFKGYLGVVLVRNIEPTSENVDIVKKRILEAEKIFPILAQCSANLESIVDTVSNIAKEYIEKTETFAVRTTRRGSHQYTSIDVNIAAGSAVQKATGASVDLTFPDKIVWIEIFQDEAYISITSGAEEHKKMWPGKPYVRRFLSKIVVGQIPYVGVLEAVKKMGVRIGRAAQTFEIGALYVTPFKPIEGDVLKLFLEGLHEGIKSRYELQKKAYHEKPRKVPVFVQDLYQFVRDNMDKPIIVTSTRGDPLVSIKDEIIDIFKSSKKIIVLIGAHEGVPTGLFRYASLVVDLAPGITISTDHALTSAIIGLITVLEEGGIFEIYTGKKKKSR